MKNEEYATCTITDGVHVNDVVYEEVAEIIY